MNRKRWCAPIVATLALLPATNASAQTAGPYTPEQAVSVLYESLRTTLGFNSVAQAKQWLSLSMIGTLVEPDDFSQVNDLANFCPATDPVLLTYNRVRKLDRIYEKINLSLVAPVKPETQEIKDANAVIRNADGSATSKYVAYNDYEAKYIAKFSEFLKSKSAEERVSLQPEIAKIRRDWGLFGYRDDIDTARGVLTSHAMRMGGPMVQRRQDILDHYRDSGLKPSDAQIGAFKSPTSELSPPVDKWPESSGWTGIKYSSDETSTHYSSTSSSSRGFGGLNLGFVTIAGSGGGNRLLEYRVSQVYKN